MSLHLSLIYPLIRKLESIFNLSPEEYDALASLPLVARTIRGDQDIARDHDRPSQCCILLDGLLYRYKLLGEGKRQIFSFHIAGDIPDLQSLHLQVMDHNIGTVVQSSVAFVPHGTMNRLIDEHPRIRNALWRDTLIDAAIFREWMAGLGRRDAYGRIAHFLCELFVRYSAVGLSNGHKIELPITQEKLGDALGLSTVHINRTLQTLRADGLIRWDRGHLNITDWNGLKRAATFDDTYLHLI
ncbi:Crp/Fnr family transcriptional regulator [Flaviflagellibacter deserti]|uniref:Crp/Fnr family transcriptional regulator n=1 Tax=Flaviflagellibacter deserti TaxID=2267266 RepID=A0ABV9YZN9_9HYPH